MTLAAPRRTPPAPAEVAAARAEVQQILEMGMTAARDWCAGRLFTTRRSFQQWEGGERHMHPAMWRLLEIQLEVLRARGSKRDLAEIGQDLARDL